MANQNISKTPFFPNATFSYQVEEPDHDVRVLDLDGFDQTTRDLGNWKGGNGFLLNADPTAANWDQMTLEDCHQEGVPRFLKQIMFGYESPILFNQLGSIP